MKIICLLSLIWVARVGLAQSESILMVESFYAIDSTSSWNIDNLYSNEFLRFGKDNTVDIGYNLNTAVWCILKIKNKDSKKNIKTWLCFDNYHIDSLTLYDNEVKLLGDRTKNTSPFIHTLAFEISLQPAEEKSIVVRVKKQTSVLEFSYRFGDGDNLARQSITRIATLSFFMGVAFLLILFNSILYYISREKLYLYYILYSTLNVIYVSIATNFAKGFLFSDFLYFSESRIYVACFWVITLSVFLSHFLNLRISQPRKFTSIYHLNIANVCMVFATVTLLLLNMLYFIELFFIANYINFIVIIGFIIWATIVQLKIDKNAATYVLIAFFPQFVWVVVIILKSFQLIPSKLHDDWLVIIILFEVFLFGYVLVRNYFKTFQKNNELIVEIISEKEKSLQAVTQVQVRERRNIANIIHDNVGSKIAYILQLMQLKKIDQAHHSITELASDIREISHRIMPKSLDEGALTSSLRNQIESLNESLQDTKIELACYDFPERINEAWIYDLYLITLEIINNAIKHGLAKSVNIEFYQYSSSYLFQFTDDGVGFDPQTIPKGFGLKNIEERVHYYHGTFELNSHERVGTIIQISIAKT